LEGRDLIKEVSTEETTSAGNIKQFLPKWNEITDDEYVLSVVEGLNIEFIDDVAPRQNKIPNEIQFSKSEKLIVTEKVESLLNGGVIVEVLEQDPDQYVSNIFLRPKRNGGHRLILNLSELNKFVEYKHFKMENFDLCLNLIQHKCFMGSVDMKDAYYSVSIAEASRKFLRFFWDGKLYEFTCMPNGLACAPRIFTKILKPVFSFLRSRGFTSVYYLDDSLIIGRSEDECLTNIRETVSLLKELGFTVNEVKSVLNPSHDIEFLGFRLNSESMEVYLSDKKKAKIRQSIESILGKHKIRVCISNRINCS